MVIIILVMLILSVRKLNRLPKIIAIRRSLRSIPKSLADEYYEYSEFAGKIGSHKIVEYSLNTYVDDLHEIDGEQICKRGYNTKYPYKDHGTKTARRLARDAKRCDQSWIVCED